MGTTAFNKDGVKFFNLSLGTSEGTELKLRLKNKKILYIYYAALSKLTSTLVPAIFQKFHDTTLIGSEADDFTDQVTDKDDTL